jgi:nucleotide-binding universal stress UspA family protein
VRNAELVAVHAWSDFFLDGRLQSPLVDPKVLRQEERALLSESLAGWQQRYPDVAVRHILVQKSPSAALLEYAPTAQLIVVGSHGRGGFTRMLLGSTSHALITHARCPVVVARHT